MKPNRDAIESGRQRGCTKSIETENEIHWCDAAIQKHDGIYFAHVSQIAEKDMVAEIYAVYFTRSFSSLAAAISVIEKETPIRFDEFGPRKGQLWFLPGILEENDLSESVRE